MEKMKSENSPDVSVIVPFYNCGIYIRDCVMSLFGQTLGDIEYIFIDDASTDDSIAQIESVAEIFPERKPYVTIIRHSENKGIAFSRIEGVKRSSGRMIIHCDADDYLENNAYENMQRQAISLNADIVGCGFRMFGDVPNETECDLISGEVNNYNLLEKIAGSHNDKLHGSLWNKMIRRELWDGVQIPVNLSYCEDVIALFQILPKATKVVYIDQPLYNYRIRENSLIKSKDKAMWEQCRILVPFLDNFAIKSSNDSGKRAGYAKIVSLLYRLLKSRNLCLDDFYDIYKQYYKILDFNRQLNVLEKQHLKYALRKDKVAASALGFFNQIGYMVIKLLRFLR